ncbi:hypothetical protein PUNSTDRAFT_117379 [Punctularia strigosozonata HHB-11173 SS5]|uniref:uncharacterized protein n=1 Tax=Punctularia strigosozonata (strain HHB-11173) TaxID=741275 RepID=UPI0004417D4A|nr:uncharacterized protein PUNSTDRAFT_117379 [Punctularia strigosozonata HHB-11173 SS5]EIN13669.1 hypothetical protein PUNSTDRAFT_117379 [Punctularia strigosozonata HHB-11173 SS5]
MIPTPDLSHLTSKDFDEVYEPAEDTFLLLDALEEDVSNLKQLNPRICLEIGSGSGCVSSFLSTLLGPSSAVFLCTDINPHAARCTVATGRQNKTPLDSVNTWLHLPLCKRLAGAVDVLLFNPPYVPTAEHEASDAQRARDISGAWAGGTDGMQVTDLLLPLVKGLLSRNGIFYLVALKQNNIPRIQTQISGMYGLQSEIVIQRRAGREHLHILKIHHKDGIDTS